MHGGTSKRKGNAVPNGWKEDKIRGLMRYLLIGIALAVAGACSSSITQVATPFSPAPVVPTETVIQQALPSTIATFYLATPSSPAPVEPFETATQPAVPSAMATLPAANEGIRFSNVGELVGLAFNHERDDSIMPLAGGASVGDFNGDGLLDIYVTNSAGPNALYLQNDDRSFTDVAQTAGVDNPDGVGNGAAAGDYDNDGDIDLFVANYHDGLLGASKLFRNDGNGTFEDVTVSAHIVDQDATFRSTGATWGDYDQDSFLDLLVVRHIGEQEPEVFSSHKYPTVARPLALYRNNGDGTFRNVTHILYGADDAHANVKGASFKPSFVDYDNDGDPDIYVVNDFGKKNHPNVLWQNDGDGRFTDVSISSRADVALSGMGLAVGDYDNDGDLDFYVSNVRASVFLENKGDSKFTDVTDRTRTGRPVIAENQNFPDYTGIAPKTNVVTRDSSIGWGTVFADFNNNGLLDLYLVAGYLDSDPQANLRNQPNAVFQNLGDGTFADVSSHSGADDAEIGREVVAADFDGDGLQDLFIVNIGDLDGNPGGVLLLHNTSANTGSWLELKLVGTASNRDGLGARISVVADGVTRIREMGASQGHQSQSVVPVHFGLGNSVEVESIVISWPSGTTQTLMNVPVNQMLTIIEP